jgi:hypothetical protein
MDDNPPVCEVCRTHRVSISQKRSGRTDYTCLQCGNEWMTVGIPETSGPAIIGRTDLRPIPRQRKSSSTWA